MLHCFSHLSTEQMVMCMKLDPANDNRNFEELRDNRDFSVILTWDPPSYTDVKTAQKQSFQEEVSKLVMQGF